MSLTSIFVKRSERREVADNADRDIRSACETVGDSSQAIRVGVLVRGASPEDTLDTAIEWMQENLLKHLLHIHEEDSSVRTPAGDDVDQIWQQL